VNDMGSKVVYWSSSPASYPKLGSALIVYEGGEYNHNITKACCGCAYNNPLPRSSDGCAVRLVIDVQ
jgi:hypothetical protein